MRIVIYTNVLSPHQLPLAREIVRKVGASGFRYVYTDELNCERSGMGWPRDVGDGWVLHSRECDAKNWLDSADVVLSGLRDFDLFDRRSKRGLKTFYMSERWFKPVTFVRMFRLNFFSISGKIRLLSPRYRQMVKRFVCWVKSDPNARCFAIGPWAQRDMLGLGVPREKIVPWGYFVAPSVYPVPTVRRQQLGSLNILWVGRMLHWKRVDTIIKALGCVNSRFDIQLKLTLVGDGQEKRHLQSLAKQEVASSSNRMVAFVPSQPISRIREIMRENDVYVLSSNAQEGWGAALSEALEEGMTAIGTYEAGASATMLQEEWLFHAGDWRCLAALLEKCIDLWVAKKLCGQGVGAWSVKKAAERLLNS